MGRTCFGPGAPCLGYGLGIFSLTNLDVKQSIPCTIVDIVAFNLMRSFWYLLLAEDPDVISWYSNCCELVWNGVDLGADLLSSYFGEHGPMPIVLLLVSLVTLES